MRRAIQETATKAFMASKHSGSACSRESPPQLASSPSRVPRTLYTPISPIHKIDCNMASASPLQVSGYRGRLAPSPTGFLHVGHARTFWTAWQRARDAGGSLVMRMEDLDPERSRAHFTEAAYDDLRWLGVRWQEGPDKGGPFGPYL